MLCATAEVKPPHVAFTSRVYCASHTRKNTVSYDLVCLRDRATACAKSNHWRYSEFHCHRDRPHRFQNCQPTLSFRSCPLALVPTRTFHRYITSPTRKNGTTAKLVQGSATKLRDSRKRLTQQKIIGVVIQHRYGRSKWGSCTRSTKRPSTARK